MLERQAGRCVVGLRPFLLFRARRSGIYVTQAGSGLDQGTGRQGVYRIGRVAAERWWWVRCGNEGGGGNGVALRPFPSFQYRWCGVSGCVQAGSGIEQ